MGSNALFSPQEIQQAGGSAPTPFSSPAPGGNLFSPDEVQKAGGGPQAPPSGVSGFLSGLYDNTVRPLIQPAQDYFQQAGEHLKNGEYLKAAGTVMSMLGGAPTDDKDPMFKIIGSLIDAHKQQAKATAESFKQGNYSEAAGHALATALPAVGPAAAQAGEDIGKGETAKGLGEATGLIASVEAPRIVGAAADAAGLANESVANSVKYVRNLYKPLANISDVQPVLQDGIRSVLSDVAEEAAVEPPKATSIRDAASEVADNIRAKSQDVFQELDRLSDGKFSDAQAEAARYRGSLDKAGKDAYAAAIEKQNSLFDQFRDKFTDPADLDEAKANWKQAARLDDLSDKIQNATTGSRPGIKGPAEELNVKSLDKGLNSLFNDGDLQSAVGEDNAHKLLDHTGNANQQIADIKRGRIEQAAQRNAFRQNVVKPAVQAGATALGVGGAAKAVSAVRKVLGGGDK